MSPARQRAVTFLEIFQSTAAEIGSVTPSAVPLQSEKVAHALPSGPPRIASRDRARTERRNLAAQNATSLSQHLAGEPTPDRSAPIHPPALPFAADAFRAAARRQAASAQARSLPPWRFSVGTSRNASPRSPLKFGELFHFDPFITLFSSELLEAHRAEKFVDGQAARGVQSEPASETLVPIRGRHCLATRPAPHKTRVVEASLRSELKHLPHGTRVGRVCDIPMAIGKKAGQYNLRNNSVAGTHIRAAKRGASGAAAGRITVNVDPMPGRLSTLTSPFIPATKCFTIARPRPVPPISRLRPLSTR